METAAHVNDVYQPRNPRGSDYFKCTQAHFEELCENVLKYVPHRQWVYSIPKRLRIYFMFDRKLLSKLSQCPI